MNPLIQKIIAIINGSFMKDRRKKTLTDALIRDTSPKNFFELLQKHLLEEARERRDLFLETQRKWKEIYTATLQEFENEEQKNEEHFLKKLSAISCLDTETKCIAFQTYSVQQRVLSQNYERKIKRLGARYMQQALQKISLAQKT